MHQIILGAFLIVISASEWTISQETRQNIAVLDLKSNALDAPSIIGFSNKVRSELVKLNKFTVIERDEMNGILREQGFQQTGCAESSCAVEIGKLLAAQKIVLGDIDLTGMTYSLTLRIVDVESGRIETSASLDCIKCSIDDALTGLVPNVCSNLVGLPYEKTPDHIASQKEAQNDTKENIRKYTRRKHIGQWLTAAGGVMLVAGIAGGSIAPNDTGVEAIDGFLILAGTPALIVGIIKWAVNSSKLRAILKTATTEENPKTDLLNETANPPRPNSNQGDSNVSTRSGRPPDSVSLHDSLAPSKPPAGSFASDIIILKSGEEMDVQITEVASDKIKYVKTAGSNGQIHFANKADVAYIQYADGRKNVSNNDGNKMSLCSYDLLAGSNTAGVLGLAGAIYDANKNSKDRPYYETLQLELFNLSEDVLKGNVAFRYMPANQLVHMQTGKKVRLDSLAKNNELHACLSVKSSLGVCMGWHKRVNMTTIWRITGPSGHKVDMKTYSESKDRQGMFPDIGDPKLKSVWLDLARENAIQFLEKLDEAL